MERPFKIENRVKDDESDDPFVNFLRHSFYKPRDIVEYLKVMQKRLIDADAGSDDSFTAQVFRDKEIRKQFSHYLLGEVRDNLSFYYKSEQFEILLRFFDFLGDYVDRQHRSFSYGDFLQAFDKLTRSCGTEPADIAGSVLESRHTTSFLYEMNTICYRIDSPNDKYPTTRWCFRERSFANIRPKVKSGCRSVMHYGVARSLYADIR